jgi:hypothetical protein
MMKTYLTLLFVACQSLAALAQDNAGKTPYLTKSLANDAINDVLVTTSAGGIMVTGRPGEAPRIEVYIKGNNNQELSKEEIEKRLANDYDMNISVNEHQLHASVKTRHDFNNWRNQLSISFKIFVPEHVTTDLKTSGGGINLDNLTGTETFKTSGGGLTIDKLKGTIRGVTSGGGINVSNSSQDIDLQTSGGGITAKNCDGKIKLGTSGGGLRLYDLKGDIEAHTSGGGIEGRNIEGDLNVGTSGGGIDLKHMACSLNANTSAGSLNVQADKLGKYMRLNASSGSINIGMPKQGMTLDLVGEHISQSRISGFTGEWEKEHVKGTVNGGGTEVEAHASSGSINISFN